MTNVVAFAVMSTVWGLTWIATKIVAEVVPPLLSAGVRFVAVGAVLLTWRLLLGYRTTVARENWRATIENALLLVAACYGLLFWGAPWVPSGVAGLIHLSVIPICLLVFGPLYGDDRPSMRHAVAVFLGFGGLAFLIVPKLADEDFSVLRGIAAIVVSALAYGWGSARSRDLLRRYDPGLFNAVIALIGGVALVFVSATTERVGADGLWPLLVPQVLVSWLFLVLLGSVLGLTIYFRLLRDWGTARTGMYAFVSSAIALWVGWFFFGESLSWVELASTVLLLAATGLSLSAPSESRNTADTSGPRRAVSA